MNTPHFIPPPRIWQPGSDTTRIEIPQNLQAFQNFTSIDDSLHQEGYRIELGVDTLSVALGSPQAIKYAWQHFQQWADGPKLQCGRLEDAPAMERRGFMLDISRCKVPTRESLAEWVHLLAGFRYNEFQLYLEHSFAYKDHESVWREASPLNSEDMLWLQALCREQGIDFVPNQNCFGHFERWLKHPEYRKYAECPDGFVSPWGQKRDVGSVLKPDLASKDLVKELLDELLPLFESPWVNIGCDETFELGQGFSKASCEKEGRGKVYTDFVREIMDHVKQAHGKRCQFWGDILLKTPEELKNLPADALALEWGYEADHPFVEDSRRFAESGLEFMICPGTSSWRTFAGRTENMLANIRNAGLAAQTNRAKGMLLTDWGDNGHLQQSPVSYPALAWCALNAWNPDSATVEDAETWCDQVAFAGKTGDTACWLAAGKIHDLLEAPRGNSSSIFELFEHPEEMAEELSEENIRKCLDAIAGLPEPLCFGNEWAQSLRNMKLSLRTGLKAKGQSGEGLDLLLEEAKSQQKKIWLKKNREGGLAESLRMYTEVANQINDGENK